MLFTVVYRTADLSKLQGSAEISAVRFKNLNGIVDLTAQVVNLKAALLTLKIDENLLIPYIYKDIH